MNKTKVFEIEPYNNVRRFMDQLTHIRTIDNTIKEASHVISDGIWKQWNGNGWSTIEEPIIVNSIEELNKQEL